MSRRTLDSRRFSYGRSVSEGSPTRWPHSERSGSPYRWPDKTLEDSFVAGHPFLK